MCKTTISSKLQLYARRLPLNIHDYYVVKTSDSNNMVISKDSSLSTKCLTAKIYRTQNIQNISLSKYVTVRYTVHPQLVIHENYTKYYDDKISSRKQNLQNENITKIFPFVRNTCCVRNTEYQRTDTRHGFTIADSTQLTPQTSHSTQLDIQQNTC